MIELLSVGASIDLGYKKASLPVYEQIFTGLSRRSECKDSLLVERMAKKVKAARKLLNIERALKNKSSINFIEINETLEEFKKCCSIDFMKDTRFNIENVVNSMKNKLKPLDEPKFISELQDLLSELQTSQYDMKDDVEKIRKRIFDGEQFSIKVKSMDNSNVRKNFSNLLDEYRTLKVKINYFEELIVAYDREEYFINNIDSIVNEDADKLTKVFKIGKRIDTFRFHRATFVSLILFNKQVASLRSKYADWQLKEGVSGFEQKCVKKFLKDESLLSKLIKKVLKMGKTLKEKLARNERNVDWSGWPGSRQPELELESLESNYIFLKRFLIMKEQTSSRHKRTEMTDVYKKKTSSKGAVSKQVDKKMIDIVTKEILRNLMKNQFYRYKEEEAIELSESIERSIRFKLRDPKRYENLFEKILKLLRKLRKGNLKNISIFIKNFEFRPKLLARLAAKKDRYLKKIEKNLGEQKPVKRKKNTFDIVDCEKDKIINSERIHKIHPARKRQHFDIDELISNNNDLGVFAVLDQEEAPYLAKRKVNKDDSFYKSIENIKVESSNTGLRKVLKVNKQPNLLERLNQATNFGAGYNFQENTNDTFGLFGERDMFDFQRQPEMQNERRLVENENQPKYYFRLFQGDFLVDDQSQRRKIRDIAIYSAFGSDFIKLFTKIPNNLYLSSKLTFIDFQSYISRVLSPQKR